MRELKKQDRTSSRLPTDTERKYKLEQIELTAEEVEQLKSKLVVDKYLSTTSYNAIANKTVTDALNNKVTKEEGKGLSTNDFTKEDKEKISSLESKVTTLEDKVEGLEPTGEEESGWKDATLTDKFAVYNSSSYARYRKIGKAVNIQAVLTPTSSDNILNSGTETTAFTLPKEYRPQQNITMLFQGSGTNVFTVGVIANSGNVNIYRYRNSSEYSSTPPSAGAWLPFNIMYFVD